MSPALRAKFPHLPTCRSSNYRPDAVRLRATTLQGQLAVSAARSVQGVDATSLQIAGVLDDLVPASAGPDHAPGPSLRHGNGDLRVWAPTARSLNCACSPIRTRDSSRYPMTLDAASGIWSYTAPAAACGKYYLYEAQVFVRSTNKVETNVVTDPYSVSLARNSTRSQVSRSTTPALQPRGWRTCQAALAAPEDIVLYELHVRDFSATTTPCPRTCAAPSRLHAEALRRHEAPGDAGPAGVTHVHLLPSFDFATINEDKTAWQSPSFDALAALPPDSSAQQSQVGATADRDGFNWGYDPLHYNVPEGSYATDPDGSERVLEFRQMVQSLNQTGLRVVMDVVYNHTTSSGQNPNSILDKLVPGYYYRLNGDGVVLNESCCADTASENAMMEKLMVDSVVQWASNTRSTASASTSWAFTSSPTC
jgi:pullulanase-type alpha-1,6-glucosidase